MQTLDSIQVPANFIDFGMTSPPIGEAAFSQVADKRSNRPQTASGRIKTNDYDEQKRRPTSAAGNKKPNVQKELDDVILKIHRKQKIIRYHGQKND